MTTTREWIESRIKPEQYEKYLDKNGNDFIADAEIEKTIGESREPSMAELQDILDKSLAVQTLSLADTARLLAVGDPEKLALMKETAGKIKKKVYNNRIVTFAPLYLGSFCVNNCLYCGFRGDNSSATRRVLSMDEIEQEIKVLAGKIGHKRLITVYGEHPKTGIDYMCASIEKIYSVKEKTKNGFGQIRRVNVNAAPMSVEDLVQLKKVGLGTFQVFQETYDRKTYAAIHPANTIKGDFRWRLYCMHRAMEAGIDDVGIGVLYGLADWKFEIMAMVCHAHELERQFGIGPHTISFPRLEDASNTPFIHSGARHVDNEDFKRIITITRLAVPYTGMILTARETPGIRRDVMHLGCTQTDASSQIGVGAYADSLGGGQEGEKQQFMLGDTRSLDEVIRELAEMGYITSFCTAGYRCGRTGDKIMGLLRSGREGQFCKLNAVLTFREWLDDFASDETKAVGEKLIIKELEECRKELPEFYDALIKSYQKIKEGERDLYF